MLTERYEKIFGEKIVPPSKNIWHVRTNSIKISPKDLERRLEMIGTIEKMEIEGGFWVRSEKNLSKTVEHILGYFFLQNASSMLPPLFLDLEQDVVLDLCASPGSKTTQMAAIMQNKGVIIANDITYKRLKALRGNLQRCGVMNTVVAKMRGENFWKTGIKFKKILLDAPCSGTGTMNPRILQETSERSVRMLSNVQKKLLFSAAKCLDDDGVIVYSTCSLEPEENEENVDFAVKELGLKTEKIDFKNGRQPVMEWQGKKFSEEVANAVRIMPNEKNEGFFICKLRK